jgi:SEL1 protein
MPPLKTKLPDMDGGIYGDGASGVGEPQSSSMLKDIEDFIEFHRYIADGNNPESRTAQVNK